MTFCYVSGNYKSENVNQETFIELCAELLPDPRPYTSGGSHPPGDKIGDSIDGNHQCEGLTGLLGESAGLPVTYPGISGKSNKSLT